MIHPQCLHGSYSKELKAWFGVRFPSCAITHSALAQQNERAPSCLSMVGNIISCKFRKWCDHWFIISEPWDRIQILLNVVPKNLLFPWTALFLWTCHHNSPAWKLQMSTAAIDCPSSPAGKLCSHTSIFWLSTENISILLYLWARKKTPEIYSAFEIGWMCIKSWSPWSAFAMES